jgi:Tol biopolymer transport system component
MGEVYRARDTKLDREVALKVLPTELSGDPERAARFEREARMLASLQHPHIASIYGYEHIEGVRFLTMELIEGEDLAERLERGQVPLNEALQIAEQVAIGLEAAHQKNIIHRDLKPANIKLDRDGMVKILDFGLARAFAGDEPDPSDLDHSPTITAAMTRAGVILGTAAYMSPEQAKGKSLDQRSDIWSFGVILYEMLHGQKMFEGETVSETMAEVMKGEIDWDALPSSTPAWLRALLRRCLDRDPRTRLQSIGEARISLQRGPAGDEPAVASAPRTPRSAARPWMAVAIISLLVALGAVIVSLQPKERGGLTEVVRATLELPPDHILVGGPEISRDGSRVAFISTDGTAPQQIYTRTLDSDELSPVMGSEGAGYCFFSPDGEWIAFYAKRGLYKAKISGGSPFLLAETPSMAGACWLTDGTIVFTMAWNSGLFRISENGGEPSPVLIPDRENHYAFVWPHPFPGETELIFNRWGKSADLMLLNLMDGSVRALLPEYWRRAIPTQSGHILFTGNGGDLLALPGTPSAGSTPTPQPVLQSVDNGQNSGHSRFSISEDGTLVYSAIDRSKRSLVSVDGEGRITDVPGAPINYETIEVSRDLRRVLVVSGFELYVQDLARGSRLPLARELARAQDRAIWHADGERALFAANHGGDWDIYAKSASDDGEVEHFLQRIYDQYPESMASDGTLIYRESHPETGDDLWLLPPEGEPEPWMATAAGERQAVFSSDADLIAFTSDASGEQEVYVRSRANRGDMIAVSTNGGFSPAWAWDEDRLYFRSANSIMMSEIRREPTLSASEPVEIFEGGWALGDPLRYGRRGYVPMPDGSFLMIRNQPEAIPMRLKVVFNWFEELGRRVPNEGR